MTPRALCAPLCALVCACEQLKTYYEAISVARSVPKAVQEAQTAMQSAYLPTGGNLWCLRERLQAYCTVRVPVWCGSWGGGGGRGEPRHRVGGPRRGQGTGPPRPLLCVLDIGAPLP